MQTNSSLGERDVTVETGEAADLATVTPHFAAIDGPAELIMIFSRDGHRAHMHSDPRRHATSGLEQPHERTEPGASSLPA